MKKIFLIIIIVLIFIVLITVTCLFNNKANFQDKTEQKYNIDIYKKALEASNGNEEEFIKNLDEFSKKLNERTMDKVSMKIKENTLSKTGATVIITDKNDMFYFFTKDDYKLEKNIFGNLWIRVPLKSDGYIVEPLGVHGPNGITEFSIDWKDRYGELEKGKYRIVMTENLYAEFNID